MRNPAGLASEQNACEEVIMTNVTIHTHFQGGGMDSEGARSIFAAFHAINDDHISASLLVQGQCGCKAWICIYLEHTLSSMIATSCSPVGPAPTIKNSVA